MKFILIIAFITLQQLFALVSIVPVEIGEKPGISGKIEAGLDTTRGNTHKDNYKASTRINYDNNSSYVLWLDLSGQYGKANYVENTNKIYSHLRYIKSITKEDIRAEVFLQTQEDKFKAIAARRVAGAGLRFKFFDTFSGAKGYYGLGGFYEYIRYINPSIDPNEDNARLNTYIAYTLDFNKDSNLTYTLYYQPRFDKMSDHVISNKFDLKLHVYSQLFLKLSIYYDVDSSAPVGIDKDYDFGQTTSFVFDF